MNRIEQAMQRAVMQHVAIRPARGVFVFHCPNGGKRSKIEAAILKGLGVVAGVPDLIAVKAGRLCALELKAPGGRLSKAQKVTIAALKAAGAAVAVADSLDGALDHLEAWGILRGKRQGAACQVIETSFPLAKARKRATPTQRAPLGLGGAFKKRHSGKASATDGRDTPWAS